jgi:phosphonate transport system substrate-binding protein
MRKTMQLIKVTSIQSENADFICQRITRYLSSRLGIDAEFINQIPWQERERLLDAGEIQLGWMCGLPYVRKVDRAGAGQAGIGIELVAAPVMRHPRYAGRPIYFSDVIVRRDGRYAAFADLRGAVWAYNEPGSQSGYNITRYHLARLGETRGYFGQVVAAGSHLKAVEMVLAHQVDASAIDSTVLELELEKRPELGEQLRIVETLGPSPIPPWVATRSVPPDLRDAIRRVFWEMHEDAEGQALLTAGQMARMAPVQDGDYDLIREMARLAEAVRW